MTLEERVVALEKMVAELEGKRCESKEPLKVDQIIGGVLVVDELRRK